jgi:hypothetical protein
LANKIFFIQFNNADKRSLALGALIHHFANRMTQLPSGFLGHANPIGQEYGENAFA